MQEYTLLPFNFTKIDEDYLATNDIGEFIFLNRQTLDKVISGNLERDCEEFADLESKFFITKNNSETFKDIYTARYRTKKRFIFESTFLHMIVVTHRCNQKCRYCHASASEESSKPETDLDKKTSEQIVDRILESPTEFIKIEFQGGEPLLNFEIIKHIVNYTNKSKNQKKVEFVICTNAIALTDEHLDFIEVNNIQISTSLDGPEKLHDSQRISNKETGTYQMVSNSLQKIRSRSKSQVSALTTIHKDNLFKIKEIVDEYVSQGLTSIFLRPLNPYGNATKNKEALYYSNDEFVKYYINALEYIIELNKKSVNIVEENAAIILSRILSPFSNGFVDIQSPSGIGLCGLIYETNGDVFVSDEARMLHTMNHNDDFLLGNVKTTNRKNWFSTKKIKSLWQDSVIESLPGCTWCAFSPYCGTDPVRNLSEAGHIITSKPKDKQCQIHKKIFNHIFLKLKYADKSTRRIFWNWATHN